MDWIPDFELGFLDLEFDVVCLYLDLETDREADGDLDLVLETDGTLV